MVEIARSEVGSQILLGIGYLDTFLERTLGYSVMIILINVIFLRICDTCHALSDELQLIVSSFRTGGSACVYDFKSNTLPR